MHRIIEIVKESALYKVVLCGGVVTFVAAQSVSAYLEKEFREESPVALYEYSPHTPEKSETQPALWAALQPVGEVRASTTFVATMPLSPLAGFTKSRFVPAYLLDPSLESRQRFSL